MTSKESLVRIKSKRYFNRMWDRQLNLGPNTSEHSGYPNILECRGDYIPHVLQGHYCETGNASLELSSHKSYGQHYIILLVTLDSIFASKHNWINLHGRFDQVFFYSNIMGTYKNFSPLSSTGREKYKALAIMTQLVLPRVVLHWYTSTDTQISQFKLVTFWLCYLNPPDFNRRTLQI